MINKFDNDESDREKVCMLKNFFNKSLRKRRINIIIPWII